MSFEGQGGAAGFARGEAKVALTPDGSGTRIEYTVNAQVGGKLAQIGSRLVDGAAAKVADDFFARFVDRFGKPPAAAVDADATEPGVAVPETASSQMRAALRAMSVRLALAAVIIA